mmetsp:Transcript_81346/g.263946  ORF Transcript_81346/g.263946 Transcript_81346/m.263946 type:complete len:217 (-) Transcript_81346:1358-2008(-)
MFGDPRQVRRRLRGQACGRCDGDNWGEGGRQDGDPWCARTVRRRQLLGLGSRGEAHSLGPLQRNTQERGRLPLGGLRARRIHRPGLQGEQRADRGFRAIERGGVLRRLRDGAADDAGQKLRLLHVASPQGARAQVSVAHPQERESRGGAAARHRWARLVPGSESRHPHPPLGLLHSAAAHEVHPQQDARRDGHGGHGGERQAPDTQGGLQHRRRER